MCGGGCIGGGVGGALGTLAGVALAPFTGGASLFLPALTGALGGFGGTALGNLIGGETFNLGPALLAGAGGALGGLGAGALSGGALGGLGGVGGLSAGAAEGAAGAGLVGDMGGLVGSGAGEGLAGSIAPQLALPSAAPALTAPEGAFFSGIPGIVNEGQAAGLGLPGMLGGDTVASGAGTAGDVLAGLDPVYGSVPTASGALGDVSTLSSAPGFGFPTDGGGIWNALKDFYKNNRDLIGGGSLLYSLGKGILGGNKPYGADELAANAGMARSIAQQFGSGNLTPAQQAAHDKNLSGAIAAIKSKYAGLGLSGSTAEVADIEDAKRRAEAGMAAAINENVRTALGALGVGNSGIQALARGQVSNDNDLARAIAMLATAGVARA